jgi:hypothetical protein
MDAYADCVIPCPYIMPISPVRSGSGVPCQAHHHGHHKGKGRATGQLQRGSALGGVCTLHAPTSGSPL